MRDFLLLEDGSVFPGRSVGAEGIAFGEAVFTTSMSRLPGGRDGPELCRADRRASRPRWWATTASQRRGSSRSGRTRVESSCAGPAGGSGASGWRARGSSRSTSVDTRSLVLRPPRARLYAGGARLGRSLHGRRCAARSPRSLRWPAGRSRPRSRRSEPYTVGNGLTRIAALDYGCKRSIVRRLVAAGASVRVLPHTATVEDVLAERPDGVLLSNGPGDPAALPTETENVRDLLGLVPLLGICLGHQLLAARRRPRDLQAPVRPPRRQPSGARARNRPRAGHVPEPRVRRPRKRRRPSRTSRSTTAPSRASSCPPSGREASSSIPRRARGRTTRAALIEDWVREVRLAEAA